MSQLIINALISEANAKESKAIANLQNYMSNSAGIGEHPDVLGAIQDQVDVIAKEQERIDDMLDFDPKELYRYNLARGLDPDAPITRAAYENLMYEHPGLGFAGGGIANVRRPWAIPPSSGPMPQGGGLSSQFNRVRKLTG